MTRERSAVATLTMPSVGSPPTPMVPRAERFQLANGLRVVAVPRHDLPQVAARLVIPAGAAADPPDAPGAASLTASLLTEGTDKLSALGFNQRIDSLGASLCARAGHDFAEIDLGLLSETLAEGLDLLRDVLVTASLPERELQRIRAEALDALEARLDEPANVADDAAAEAVYGTAHPYARLPIGTPESVRMIRRAELLHFYQARYRPGGSVLLIAGDFDVDRLRAKLEATLINWSGPTVSTSYPPLPGSPPGAGTLEALEWEDAAQGEIRVSGFGMARDSDDWVPASVANYILGGSTITGRLGANLREDKGWTYGVRSGFSAGIHPAGWSVETAVEAEASREALTEILREIERMITEPVTEEELNRAKIAMVLSLPRAFETPTRIVARLATVEAFGLATDYWDRYPERVESVTLEEVQRMAERYFAPSSLARTIVGPPAGG